MVMKNARNHQSLLVKYSKAILKKKKYVSIKGTKHKVECLKAAMKLTLKISKFQNIIAESQDGKGETEYSHQKIFQFLKGNLFIFKTIKRFTKLISQHRMKIK